MHPTQTDTVKPWYTHRWPWLLMLGPALAIVAGIHTAWLAMSGQDALVVDDYYKEGKAINQDLRRDKLAASLRLHVHMRYDAAAGRLIGSISSLERPQLGTVVVRLIHPTQPDKDMRLVAQPDEHGNFSLGLPLLDRAHWHVLIESEVRDWRLHDEWAWPQQEIVDIKAG